MSTKRYQMWLNYDQDGQTFRFPVLPEKIVYSTKGNSTSIQIDQFGEVFHIGKRDAIKISFFCFFPAQYDQSVSCTEGAFVSAKKAHKYMMSMLEKEKPLHFVLTGSPLAINCHVTLDSYKAHEIGGDVGTVYYEISMSECRNPKIKKISNPNTSSSGKTTVKVETVPSRQNNSAKVTSHTVKTNDCLWNLALKYYGDGTKENLIYNANKDAIESAARKMGRSSSNNGWWIYPGTVLTIP